MLTGRRGLRRAVAGDLLEARAQLRRQICGRHLVLSAVERDRAVSNLAAVEAALGHRERAWRLLESLSQKCSSPSAAIHNRNMLAESFARCPSRHEKSFPRARVAVVSFLFNWPSTGGGIVHTVELTQFLQRAGYDVQLIHPVYPEWGIGQVSENCPVATTPLPFAPQEWTVARIRERFRQAVDRFAPDQVILTDCWNFKPHLAATLRDYSCLWRMQASECLCPLNNLRLQPVPGGGVRQCPTNQLSSPGTCHTCLMNNERFSGSLHRAERELSGVGTPEYQALLLETVREARAILVLNRSLQAQWEPFHEDVRMVTWGMDAARFPDPASASESPRTRLLFAGLPQEPMKGFTVLREACRQLWQKRQDFEVLVTATAEQLTSTEPFLISIGWQSQEQLPQWYRAADLVVVPTIAAEALSRTAAEGMASARPVLGSRIGGLPELIEEGITGWLAEPGDVHDWMRQLAWFLDHPVERQKMGLEGRRRFEATLTWERVIEEQYAPLLKQETEVRGQGSAKKAFLIPES